MLKAHKLKNKVYNPAFKWSKEVDGKFPDGWLPLGGGPATEWSWLDTNNKKKIRIQNPHPLETGIRQEKNVFISIGEKQKWLAGAFMEAKPGETLYIRIIFTTPSGFVSGVKELTFTSVEGVTFYRQIIDTPPNKQAVLVEVGVKGKGILNIFKVFLGKLYPKKVLALDEKGRIFVNTVSKVEEVNKLNNVSNVKRVEEISRVNDVKRIEEIVKPVKIEGPIDVKVDVEVEVDFRDLSAQRDSIQIYGTDGTTLFPIKTNNLGELQVGLAGRGFISLFEAVTTVDTFTPSTSRDVSQRSLMTFAVKNTGANPAELQLQLSPDNVVWADDGILEMVASGKMIFFTPRFFLSYMRVLFRSANVAQPTNLEIWLQGQT